MYPEFADKCSADLVHDLTYNLREGYVEPEDDEMTIMPGITLPAIREEETSDEEDAGQRPEGEGGGGGGGDGRDEDEDDDEEEAGERSTACSDTEDDGAAGSWNGDDEDRRQLTPTMEAGSGRPRSPTISPVGLAPPQPPCVGAPIDKELTVGGLHHHLGRTSLPSSPQQQIRTRLLLRIFFQPSVRMCVVCVCVYTVCVQCAYTVCVHFLYTVCWLLQNLARRWNGITP